MPRPAGKSQGKTTKMVSVRIDTVVWDQARATAHANGEYLSEVLTRALRDYVANAPKQPSRTRPAAAPARAPRIAGSPAS